mmetsp:Transcript_6182/g.12130  ORF Transcript_6182/g.12130 Transcript_6182/m.12130 type:complete len:155 (-) Transcript_6182:253-717(-)
MTWNNSLGGEEGSSDEGIVLFTTSCAGNAKVSSDTRRMKYLLRAKGVEYKEVDLSDNPLDRFRMLEQSDCTVTLPQLHVNNRFVGTADDVQEYEDFGGLDDLLFGVDPQIVKDRIDRVVSLRVQGLACGGVERKQAFLHPSSQTVEGTTKEHTD